MLYLFERAIPRFKFVTSFSFLPLKQLVFHQNFLHLLSIGYGLSQVAVVEKQVNLVRVLPNFSYPLKPFL
jgi:hypothetical protein